MSLSYRLRGKLSGHAVPEYALAVGSVAVVSILGLTVLGGSISGLFDGVTGKTSGKATVPGATQSAGALESSMQILAPVSASGHVLKLGNGQSVDLGNYPSNIEQSLQTSGANGTTEKLLATMDSILAAVKSSQDLTPEQRSALASLSNKGHDIAHIQGLVVSAYEAHVGDREGFVNSRVTYGGEDTDVLQLAGQIGFSLASDGDQPEIVAFRGLLEKAVASGALSDPAARRSVEVLVNQIANVANGVESATMNVSDGLYDIGEFSEGIIWSLVERDENMGLNTAEESLLTLDLPATNHGRSAEICTIGKGTDSGTNCR